VVVVVVVSLDLVVVDSLATDVVVVLTHGITLSDTRVPPSKVQTHLDVVDVPVVLGLRVVVLVVVHLNKQRKNQIAFSFRFSKRTHRCSNKKNIP
jgi:hypothetical protein